MSPEERVGNERVPEVRLEELVDGVGGGELTHGRQRKGLDDKVTLTTEQI